MTEKRFTMSYRYLSEVNNDIAIADDGIPCTQRKVCKLLNELNDENEQLKKKNQRLEKQKNVLIDYMDNWCPKRFYNGIIKRMEEVE